MAAITNLARIKAITADDSFIDGLTGADPIVNQVLGYVDVEVQSDHFGVRTQQAQDYLGAHYLSMAGQANGGRGPLSTRTVGGVNTGFTLPYLNRTTVRGATQYGNQYLDIRDAVTAAFRVIVSS